MNRRKLSFFVFALFVLLAAYCFPVGMTADGETSTESKIVEVKEATPRLKQFMRKKLAASDQIMEGLTTPDFALLRKGATAMIHMSKEAVWETDAGLVYTQDTADFVRSAERIIRMANAKDLEGAALTYSQLTLQCVHCHRRVRREKVVRVPRGPLSVSG